MEDDEDGDGESVLENSCNEQENENLQGVPSPIHTLGFVWSCNFAPAILPSIMEHDVDGDGESDGEFNEELHIESDGESHGESELELSEDNEDEGVQESVPPIPSSFSPPPQLRRSPRLANVVTTMPQPAILPTPLTYLPTPVLRRSPRLALLTRVSYVGMC